MMKTIKLNANSKLTLLTLLFLMGVSTATAQWGNGGGGWGDNSGGGGWGDNSSKKKKKKKKAVESQPTESTTQNTEEPDTSNTDENYPDENVDNNADGGGDWGGSGGGSWGGGFGGKAKPVYVKPPKPPYVRFVAPYDSLRELLIYKGVVEEPYAECEYCTPDSLYYRAKNYLKARFGKRQLKRFTEEDVKNEKLDLNLRVPVMVPASSFVKKQQGEATFKMILQFRDGRWKYKIYNFVHIEAPNALQKDESTTYFEYYVKSKKHIERHDKPLIAMDVWVKNTVAELTKAINEPYALKSDALDEEDDW